MNISSPTQVRKNFPNEVYLNGEWLAHDKAVISVFDRGFLLGDGIYEVTPFYKGKAFMIQEHLDRLQYCLNEIGMEYNTAALKDVMLSAVSRAGFSNKDCAVYIQITRGVAPRTHFFPESSEPTVLLYAFPVSLEGFEDKQWKVLVSEDLRWSRCDIKSISLMANIKANDESHRLGLDETLLLRKGFFTEGSHTSIFFVKNGVVFTHPEGGEILSGITRKVIINLCRELQIEVREKAVPVSALREIDEVFLTGTTTQVLSVKSMRLDAEEIIIAKKSGNITRIIQDAFIKKTRSL